MPLPEVAESTPGHRVIRLTVEIVGREVPYEGCFVRVKGSGKPPVWFPWQVVGIADGVPWEAKFFVPVWFYRTVREKL